MRTIIIEVEHGIVNNVYYENNDNSDIDYLVLDWDSIAENGLFPTLRNMGASDDMLKPYKELAESSSHHHKYIIKNVIHEIVESLEFGG